MTSKLLNFIVVHYPSFVRTRLGHSLLWHLVRRQKPSIKRTY